MSHESTYIILREIQRDRDGLREREEGLLKPEAANRKKK